MLVPLDRGLSESGSAHSLSFQLTGCLVIKNTCRFYPAGVVKSLCNYFLVPSDSSSSSGNSQVGKETVKNAKAVGKHKIKVTWKKDTAADGYQIAYRIKGGSWQYTTVTSEDTLSKTLTGLKSGKTYQIKVRAYENVNGEKVYGSYSTIKKVKCK